MKRFWWINERNEWNTEFLDAVSDVSFAILVGNPKNSTVPIIQLIERSESPNRSIKPLNMRCIIQLNISIYINVHCFHFNWEGFVKSDWTNPTLQIWAPRISDSNYLYLLIYQICLGFQPCISFPVCYKQTKVHETAGQKFVFHFYTFLRHIHHSYLCNTKLLAILKP